MSEEPVPQVPASWEVQGSRPADGMVFMEDVYSVRTPRGELTLDVSWTAPRKSDGHFICVLVAGDEWDAPIEKFETSRAIEANDWIRSALLTMEQFSGSEAQHAPPQPAFTPFAFVPSTFEQSDSIRAP